MNLFSPSIDVKQILTAINILWIRTKGSSKFDFSPLEYKVFARFYLHLLNNKRQLFSLIDNTGSHSTFEFPSRVNLSSHSLYCT